MGHEALNRLFSLLEKHRCGQPQAEACFYTRCCEHIFCKMCVGSTFFLRIIHWLRGSIVFFHTGLLPAACAERGERSDLLPLERGRGPELRVVHSRDVELMAN